MTTLKFSKKRNVRKKLVKATSLLLDYIVRKHGGIRDVARQVGHSPQLINWWIQCGEVPLRHVGRIADKLHEPPEVFNYEGVASLFEVMDFESLLEHLVTDTLFRKKILTGQLPHGRKELLA